ncbi:RNA polymerase sigma factor, sigma-70 family [Armatimonadetes bacterium GBS]|jgi:RNA polymerase sigma factor (sigma-70 family)|nr:MAG: hypothetical protein KatS3mg021_0287 [Fimbriimonadales bacterium]CUU03606.1 RNA polymerase sigma factor, sigma-70 family [Armatimonadetes bacterium GBS]CUU36465.1 RNA polymerase sigma factor, sigma-70 family [Armatimonadetes bacterium GXS]
MPELQKAARAAVRYACQHFCPPAYSSDYWRDECLQIAAVTVWHASRHYKPDYGVSFTTYAYICALRALKREYQQVAHMYQHEAPWPTNPETEEELEVADANAQEAVERAVWWSELWDALKKLEAHDHWLVQQVWIEGRSQKEVAQEVGVSQATLSRRLARVKAQLRQLLGDSG